MKFNKNSLKIELLQKYLFVIITLIFFSILIWIIDKGFDLTDEGYQLLGYSNAQEIGIPANLSFYHLIVRNVFGWINLDILNTRILRLCLSIISTIIFIHGFHKMIIKYFKQNKYQYAQYSFLFIGTFMSYAFGPQAISYNHLVQFISLICFGLLFMVICSPSNDNKILFRSYIFISIIGLLTSLELFIKPTSAIIQIALFYIFIIFFHRFDDSNKRLLSLFALTFGITVGFFFVNNYILDFNELYSIIKHTSLSSPAGHNLFSLFKDAVRIILIVSMSLIPILIRNTSFFSKLFFNNNYNNIILLLYYFIIITIYIGYENHPHRVISGLYLISVTYYFSNQYLNRKYLFNHLEKSIIIIMLFIQPFIIGFGSDNTAIVTAVFGITFWSSIILIAIINKIYNNIVNGFITGSLLCLSTYIFINNVILEPYRIKPIFNQTEKFDIKKAKNIKVDNETKKFVEQVYNTLNKYNFKKGDPIIAYNRLLGLLFLIDGVSPGSLLWSISGYDSFSLSLKKSKKEYNHPYIITTGKPDNIFFTNLKTDNKINFPEEYKRVNNIVYNRYGWRTWNGMEYTWGAPDQLLINIYVHRSKL